MFPSTSSLALLLAAGASLVSGTATPTSPDASTVAAIGSTLKAQWTVDTTGTWSDMTVQLMTGNNYAMVALKTLTTGIDATSETSYSFEVPEVTPTSAIYFLQFHPTSNATDVQWTTRFTISGTDGSTIDPTNSTQPGGAAIPWGTGALVSNGTSSPSGSAATTVPASSSVVVTSTAVVQASSTASEVSTATTTANVVAVASSSSSSDSSNLKTSASAALASASSSAVSNTSGASQVVGGSLGAALLALVGYAFML